MNIQFTEMKSLLTSAALMLVCFSGGIKAQDKVNIGKNEIKLEGNTLTPEALWAMGRIANVQASPDGKKVLYQVGYYSVKENKGHQVLYTMNVDGTDVKQLTTSAEDETDAVWINNGGKIAYLSKGQIYTINADGPGKKQLTNDKKI